MSDQNKRAIILIDAEIEKTKTSFRNAINDRDMYLESLHAAQVRIKNYTIKIEALSNSKAHLEEQEAA